jgi:hypothetical protein
VYRRIVSLSGQKRLHLQVDADNFFAALILGESRALAEIGEAQMRQAGKV